MVLVDTSVWVDHLRSGNRRLEALLLDAEVACHPYIIGELACGTLRNREEILGLLQDLPNLAPVTVEEALFFIDRHRLMGLGIGYIDVHLLASAVLSDTPLWTKDRRLKNAATAQGIAYIEPLT